LAGAPPRLHGLPPLVSADTRLLILGSFPGAASLARQQYYAHPQNQFWPIFQSIWPSMARLQSADSYEERSEWLLTQGVGVWDVYASCERQGSLDTAIRHAQVNDFSALVHQCPQLRAIAHNGGESFKHSALVSASFRAAGLSPLPAHKLPSTSPANASWRFERKLAAWRAVMAEAGLVAKPSPAAITAP
jgi:hypoxanthine-DNA glycosylase